MTIRARLIGSAALTTLLSAILGLVLIGNAREVTHLVDRAHWADELVDQASMLSSLTYDYLTHPGDRARDQWSIVQKRIEGTLDRHALTGTPEEERLAGLRRQNRRLLDAFGRMVDVRADLETASATPEAARELSTRLAGQIAARIQALEREIIALQERALQSIARAQKRLVGSILLFVGALVVVIPISGFLIVRSIARPVAALMRGTAVVAAGDLSHKVGTLADDELGELSRAFDRMTESLRATTVSRDELARSEERFRTLLTGSPFPLVVIDTGGRIVIVNEQTCELFGYEEEELIGQKLEILLPSRFRAEHPRLRGEYMRQPSVRVMGQGRNLTGLRKDSIEIPIEIGLSVVEGAEGRLAIANSWRICLTSCARL